jgi:hypothetical protein
MAATTMKTKRKSPAAKTKEQATQSKAQRNAELRRLIIEKAGVSKDWAKDHFDSHLLKHFAAHARAGAARLLLWSRGGDGR